MNKCQIARPKGVISNKKLLTALRLYDLERYHLLYLVLIYKLEFWPIIIYSKVNDNATRGAFNQGIVIVNSLVMPFWRCHSQWLIGINKKVHLAMENHTRGCTDHVSLALWRRWKNLIQGGDFASARSFNKTCRGIRFCCNEVLIMNFKGDAGEYWSSSFIVKEERQTFRCYLKWSVIFAEYLFVINNGFYRYTLFLS